jgi:hypothetical protein
MGMTDIPDALKNAKAVVLTVGLGRAFLDRTCAPRKSHRFYRPPSKPSD